jgi:hypothetical protein
LLAAIGLPNLLVFHRANPLEAISLPNPQALVAANSHPNYLVANFLEAKGPPTLEVVAMDTHPYNVHDDAHAQVYP